MNALAKISLQACIYQIRRAWNARIHDQACKRHDEVILLVIQGIRNRVASLPKIRAICPAQILAIDVA